MKVTVGTFKADDMTFDLIDEVLKSGRISYGPKSMAFERQFAELHSSRYAILSNSGTSSLHVALQALKELHGWEDGDEVLVPASTFVAGVNIVLHNNMRPVFVDVEPLTYGMDPELVDDKISDRTRAMIPAHLYGQPCLITELVGKADLHDLAVIEDSCESMFVSCQGARVGSIGDIGCFSTYNAHLITTGVGGIATTNDPGYAAKMRSLVNHGLDIEELYTDEHYSPRPAVGRSFRFTHAGHSYRITELEAAIGLAQLHRYREMLRTRRRNARHLTAIFRQINQSYGTNFKIPRIAPGNEHSWMMFPIVCDELVVKKAELLPYLNERHIETRDMMPIVSQPIYQDMIEPNDYPYALHLERNGFYLGCHQDLNDNHLEYVRQIVIEFIRKAGVRL